MISTYIRFSTKNNKIVENYRFLFKNIVYLFIGDTEDSFK